MKVALLTDGITPYVTGGMQRHSFNLCRALIAQGVKVDLYHCDPQGRGAASLDCFNYAEKESITATLVEFPSMGTMPGHYIKESFEYSRRIYQQLSKKSRADFIYAKGFTGWELLNQKAKGESLPPVGVNLHGYEMFQKQPTWRSRLEASLFLRYPAKFCMTHADYLFSYGGKITTLLQSLGIPDKKIVSIPGGIGAEWLSSLPAPAHQPVRFLFVGRAERRKGIEELNATIRKLLHTHRGKFEFEFLGPIPSQQKIAGCYYHGEITDPESIRKVYSQNDILVVPSHSEGMPNVILEAMASGLGIVATDVGAVSEMVNGQTGWLLPTPEGSVLSAALITVIESDPAVIQAIKTASLNRVKADFTWDIIGRKTLAFLKTAVL
jgi:glycosyltransferase involved in cell wall biosynthesis